MRECKLGPVPSQVIAPEIPDHVRNWIAGEERDSDNRSWVDKLDPATGRLLCRLARSGAADVASAVDAAAKAQPPWAAVPAVERGMILLDLVRVMQSHRDLLAEFVARETGKSRKDASGEVGGAIQLGLFFAGEGQRLYGRTTTSGTPHRQALTVREPIGVAGLIVPAVVNAGTYGSEPHMPFGGVKQSGNGTREPGTEALDVYSSVKDIYMNLVPARANG